MEVAAAAAKSLQLCPTLCDPLDCSTLMAESEKELESLLITVKEES